jgi:hypothetical protein
MVEGNIMKQPFKLVVEIWYTMTDGRLLTGGEYLLVVSTYWWQLLMSTYWWRVLTGGEYLLVVSTYWW